MGNINGIQHPDYTATTSRQALGYDFLRFRRRPEEELHATGIGARYRLKFGQGARRREWLSSFAVAVFQYGRVVGGHGVACFATFGAEEKRIFQVPIGVGENVVISATRRVKLKIRALDFSGFTRVVPALTHVPKFFVILSANTPNSTSRNLRRFPMVPHNEE